MTMSSPFPPPPPHYSTHYLLPPTLWRANFPKTWPETSRSPPSPSPPPSPPPIAILPPWPAPPATATPGTGPAAMRTPSGGTSWRNKCGRWRRGGLRRLLHRLRRRNPVARGGGGWWGLGGRIWGGGRKCWVRLRREDQQRRGRSTRFRSVRAPAGRFRWYSPAASSFRPSASGEARRGCEGGSSSSSGEQIAVGITDYKL